jgi:hypothetical protein
MAVPACVVTVGIAVQAAAFGRAPKDSLVAAATLRELVRYRVMRGVETVDGRPIATTCIQGLVRIRGRGLAHTASVLLADGERLFDAGFGVRRLVRPSHSLAADLEDRVRFVLAACPRYLGDHLATELVHGRSVEAVDERSDGQRAATIIAGSRHTKLALDVTRVSHKPIALSLSEGRLRGSSDLVPGGGAAAIRRVQRAFDLGSHRGHVRA